LVGIFLIQLAIKSLVSFPPHPLSVYALTGERKWTKYCIFNHWYYCL